MKINLGFRFKIIFPILFIITFFIILTAFFLVGEIKEMTQSHIDSELFGLLNQKQLEMKNFFVERTQIPKTVFNDPFILDFFEKYRYYRQPVRYNTAYKQMVAYFQNIVNADATIKSVYFATMNTGEYFDHEGRYEEEGYSVMDRPWWQHAIDRDRLYCELGDIDVSDGTTPASLQTTVYNDKGILMGVGGIDIRLDAICEMVEKARYHEKGMAFLLNENHEMIYFSSMKKRNVWFKPVSELDKILDDTRSFTELQTALEQDSLGRGDIPVKIRDIHHTAYYIPFDLPELDIHWTLGMLIPRSFIMQPVQRIQVRAVTVCIVILALIILISYWVLTKNIQPLYLLSKRLKELGAGSHDLYNELPVPSLDAIGRTIYHFNDFIGQMRGFLLRVESNSSRVIEAVNSLNDQSGHIQQNVEHMATQSQNVNMAAAKMKDAINQIQRGISDLSNHSKIAYASTEKGNYMVEKRIQRLKDFIAAATELSQEMNHVRDSVSSLNHSLQFIDEISKRTSILSVNASIQSVKAGEFGSGFSAVADEIQEISNETVKTNTEIMEQIHNFQSQMNVFNQQVDQLQKEIEAEIKESNQIKTTFQVIRGDVSRTDQAVGNMRLSTSTQLDSIKIVSDSFEQVADGMHQMVDVVGIIANTSNQVAQYVQELQTLLKAYQLKPTD